MTTSLATSVPQETHWGSRLDSQNDALFQQGYRAFCCDGSLFVRKPDGTRYMVNPQQQTCSCPARGDCKHKRSLVSLVFLSMDELSHRRKWAAYDALCEYWHQYCVRTVAR